MASRKRIGIIFQYDESWTGGLYYLFNIINALKLLPDADRPFLVFFYKHDELKPKISALGYPHAEFRPIDKPLTFFGMYYGKVMRRLVGRSYRFVPQYSRSFVDFVFPCDRPAFLTTGSLQRIRKIFWIADFQHKHLPGFFPKEEIDLRDEVFAGIAQADVTLVLSSQAARKDFDIFYNGHKALVKVMPFASVLPEYQQVDIDLLKKKYGIVGPYFIVPNQFWIHKNHWVVLKAAVLLKARFLSYQIAMTGRENDFRNPTYADELKQFVVGENLNGTVKFLGFIDRREQLQLINHSLAVIQPSLFEGWSTVVEDAKAMGKDLILSNLDVHKEQCADNARYFNPRDEKDLAEQMAAALSGSGTAPPSINYDRHIARFANEVIHLDN